MSKKTIFSSLIITLVSVAASLTAVMIFTSAIQIPSPENLRTLTPTVPPVSSAKLPSFEDVAEYSVNTVVHVKSEFMVKTRFYDDYFGLFSRPGMRRVEGFGSGVVISADGYIITNNHVVEGAESVEITFNNRRVFPAKIIGTDPSTDLALLKVDAKNLEFLRFGNSDLVRLGEWVLAVGNPFNLNSTVTAGIVSAKARNINILSQNMRGSAGAIESFIQTDAAVNRGNSGGALVNLRGELIGINTAIASTSGTFAGYSFAVPANIAKKVSEDLRAFGQIQRAFLGILFTPMYQHAAATNKMEDIDGLLISRITETGAAKKAGVQLGDILLRINGRPVNTEGDFFEIIGQLRPGETIELTYSRKSQILQANAILQDMDGGTQKRTVIEW
ncbi:MAG: trypsin-like peptidase domain-containing protein [Bacteroidales bacterium]|jgi:S1-C subfamily serine protease|nr:trypsin-like peptidase domain-containing protein [Bacteroidales bacterium]